MTTGRVKNNNKYYTVFLAETHGRSALGQQETFLHFASNTWILAREEDNSCKRYNVNTFTAEQNTTSGQKESTVLK